MKKRIGLFLVSRTTGYQNLLAQAAADAAAVHGFELEVFSAEDVGAHQSADVVRFVENGGSDQLGVVIMPVRDMGREALVDGLAHKVLSRGAAWIVLNRDLETHVLRMRKTFPNLPTALVTIDNVEIGRIQARQVSAVLPPGRPAAVVYVVGNAYTTAARDRREGFLGGLGSNRIAMHEVEGLWSAAWAERMVGRWLGAVGPADLVDAVVCQNDAMAIGARTALTRLAGELNRPEWLKAPVFGVDGAPDEGRRLVDEGQLAGTVVVPRTSGTAVEILARMWRDEASQPARTVLSVSAYPAAAPLLSAAG
jgi:ABC-type sugar transport system substrate-binding protein